MRISTAQFYQQGSTAIAEMQSRVARSQMQLASGNRMLTPSDDPVGAARLLDLNAAIDRNDQYQRNANMARNRLGMEEQTLTDVENVLFRIRDLAVQANNDTLDSTTRSYIAAETEQALEQLVQLANTRDAEGSYLFSGYSVNTRPFAQTSTGVRYDGDQGQRQIQISETRNVADGDSGSAIFMSIPNGRDNFAVSANSANNGTGVLGARSLTDADLWDAGNYTVAFSAPDSYAVISGAGGIIATGSYADGDTIDVQGVSIVMTGTPAAGDQFNVGPSQNQDMFTTVQNFIDAMGSSTDPAGTATLHNQVGNVLDNLDRGIDNVLEFRTRVGTRLQAIDSQELTNADFALTLQTARAEVQELDYAEAITRLSQQLTGLEAAQQSFVRIQGLNLFRLI